VQKTVQAVCDASAAATIHVFDGLRNAAEMPKGPHLLLLLLATPSSTDMAVFEAMALAF